MSPQGPYEGTRLGGDRRSCLWAVNREGASRSWKEPLREEQPCPHLDFSPVRPVLDSGLQCWQVRHPCGRSH